KFDLTQTNQGSGPGQWPHTFDVAPESKPVVVKTVELDDMPTAVYAGFSGPAKYKKLGALIATMHGKLLEYEVGGLIDKTEVRAEDIKQISASDVGRNVTHIALSKHDEGNDQGTHGSSFTDVVMAARAEREVQFVSYFDKPGEIVRRIADGRMNDPISVDDEMHSHYVLVVADYTGRQVLGFRYGMFQYRNFDPTRNVDPIGPGPDGKDAFDFGGSWATAGFPFAVTSTNVN
ncbi:MAG: hypothetical protein H3C62_16775, partial [Gemmatimonadaceae bacterium]|nr:hypothetical protein [Gemmatimonadaceae bacterium]